MGWAHNTITPEALKEALSDPSITDIEADIMMSEDPSNGDSADAVPVM